MELVEKAWGHEEIIVNNGNYCGKLLYLKKGARGSIHYHKKKHETFYVLRGKVTLRWGKLEVTMPQGQSLEVKPGLVHSFRGEEDSIIIEFSTHHDDEDTYRINESEPAK